MAFFVSLIKLNNSKDELKDFVLAVNVNGLVESLKFKSEALWGKCICSFLLMYLLISCRNKIKNISVKISIKIELKIDHPTIEKNIYK